MVIKCCKEGVQGAVEEEKGIWPSLGVNLADFNSLGFPDLARVAF